MKTKDKPHYLKKAKNWNMVLLPSFPDYYNVVLKEPVPTAFFHQPRYKSLQIFITRFN